MRALHLQIATLTLVVATQSGLANAQPGQDEPISPYASAAEVKTPEPQPQVGVVPSRAVVRHVPPVEAQPDQPLRLLAVIENAWVEDGLVAHYRVPGNTSYLDLDFERSSAGGYFAQIPASDMGREGVEYYISGRSDGALHFGSPEAPHPVRVEPKAVDRWIEAERKRLGGRHYAVDASLAMYDFGSTHGRDRFVRGHIDWSYLLVDRLYAIHLGFAFVEGDTPSGIMSDARSERAAVRYGYGGLRWRLRDKIWFDGKAMMGFGQEGFAAGLGGALTLGNDWRTAVTVGAEAMSELSYKAWLRLQWDTVPFVLMSAEVATTNQPDAKIDAGSYVEFKVRYPLSNAFEIAGTINYGARGNRPGGFGGGLHTNYRF